MAVVLITDPEQRAALAAARSLARDGKQVITVGRSRGLAGASRAVRRSIVLPDADVADPERFREAMRAAVVATGASVVVPVTDGTSRALLGHEAQLGAVIAGPSADAYERASNKALLMELAPRCGLVAPAQAVASVRSELESAADQVGYPLVLKPARSIVDVDGVPARVGVRFVDRPDELASAGDRYPPAAYPLLVQSRAIGDGLGVFLLRVGGRVVLRFGHRRLREKPPAGGVSTYREAVAPPAELLDACERLLQLLEYDGPAMVELKEDRERGRVVLMEINARLWGSVQLAIDAGVDFPAMLVRSALGEPIPEAPSARLGTRTYWELGEVDHALALARRSRAALHLPSGTAVGVGAALRSVLDRRWQDHPEVWRWSDPGPFFSELMAWIRGQ